MSIHTAEATENTTDEPTSEVPVLEVTDLNVTFQGLGGNPDVHAVRGVSYAVHR